MTTEQYNTAVEQMTDEDYARLIGFKETHLEDNDYSWMGEKDEQIENI